MVYARTIMFQRKCSGHLAPEKVHLRQDLREATIIVKLEGAKELLSFHVQIRSKDFDCEAFMFPNKRMFIEK